MPSLIGNKPNQVPSNGDLGTLAFQDANAVNITGGVITASGAFSANGGATLGDASGDALTINSSAVSIPNGLNFDSNTLVIDATNNYVGVNRTPTIEFDVAGRIRSQITGGTPTFFLNNGTTQNSITNTSGAFTFATDASERMRITSAGNVGIGTSSPAYKLDVAGANNTRAFNIAGATTGYTFAKISNTSGELILGVGDASSGALFGGMVANAAVIGTSIAKPLQFATNDTVKATLDSSGNLGLGVTPSAWGGVKAFDINTAGALYATTSGVYVSNNSYFDGSSNRYKTTATAALYEQFQNTHRWYNAASGTAGNTITFTQAMTLNSGLLSVGTTTGSAMITSSANLGVQNGYAAVDSGTTYGQGYQFFRFLNSSLAYTGAISHTESTGIGLYSASNLIFGTGTTERMRIDSSGNLLVGTTSELAKLSVSGGKATTGIVASLVNTGSGTNSKVHYSDGTTYNWTAGTTGNNFTWSTGEYGALAGTERMRIDASGNLLVGTTNNGSTAKIMCNGLLAVRTDGNGNRSMLVNLVSNENFNGAATTIYVGRDGSTSRSINAGGTVNASGADYAEYMVKAGDFAIAKGDICGIDVNGKLTNIFDDAISFVVKSTDPSYVGGDTWGIDLDGDALETARQTVDRIAFAGQVPVNVIGSIAGQYIIPVNDNGSIKGQAVSNPTFEQYQLAVGKVIAIENDGRARIIVKVA